MLMLFFKDSLGIIEKLIEKQTGFEKLLQAQEDRFTQLENLTAVS